MGDLDNSGYLVTKGIIGHKWDNNGIIEHELDN